MDTEEEIEGVREQEGEKEKLKIRQKDGGNARVREGGRFMERAERVMQSLLI